MQHLEHAHLDLRERIRIGKVAERYRSGSLGYDDCIRELISMGYERGSVRKYVELLSSTCDDYRFSDRHRSTVYDS